MSHRSPRSPRRNLWLRAGVPALVVAAAAAAARPTPDASATTAAPAPGLRTSAAALHAAVSTVRDSALVALAPVPRGGLDDAMADLTAALVPGGDELRGRSGKLRARFVEPRRGMEVAAISRLFGEKELSTPGVHPLPEEATGQPFSLITLVPFEQKVRGRIGTYRMGFWPGEQGRARSEAYGNPAGFIQVTKENQDTHLSEHFRLRDFLTKDQFAVWPKYVVLREELLDKLELVIQELEASGTPVKHVSVMSGFRTPQYNANGGNTAGRASNSRHQYGDAADVFVDNDRNGRLDDLNGDGRVDTRDVRVMIAAVERVERRYPELVGGAGVYKATSAHGPFIHVDVRGSRARW
ncbi:MAG TPA: D-Ala-D-Ala carboxypeptidase family metallohydrolase [Gemmatimonadales bacterium]